MGTRLGGTPSAVPSSKAEEVACQPQETSPGKGRNDVGEGKTGCSPRHTREARVSPHLVRTGSGRGREAESKRGDAEGDRGRGRIEREGRKRNWGWERD